MDIITEIAKMIDHSLLHPTLTDEGLRAGCNLAKKYHVASVCVKPYAVKLAKIWLKDSDVLVGTVIGFPHGNSPINVKAFETQQAIEDGAVEIDMVINLGKAAMEDWTYIEKEISEIREVTAKSNIILKVIFENDLITEASHKIKLCEI
jgi:deoxyribose-phosphate aldolase